MLAASLFVIVPVLMGDMRRDEFLCEEAHAHLADCCPGFKTGPGVCEHVDGCDYSDDPDLTPAQSDCLRAKSCEELRDQGICALVTPKDANGTVDLAAAGVCR